MKVLTVDMETFYSREFSLTKLTTEEYIRHPDFEVIGVSVQVDSDEPVWFSGTRKETKEFLEAFDFGNNLALAHNAMFDAAILNWHFDIRPKGWLDTLSMARALHGTEVGGSLAVLAKHYGLGVKGDEVINAMGKRRADFNAEDLARYGDYCRNDVALTWLLFNAMSAEFPKVELRLIDLTIRMFSEPVLQLWQGLLLGYYKQVVKAKQDLLDGVTVDRTQLMSNPKLAAMLKELGVVPPMKISPTTGKETYAFAKNDEEFKALLQHPDLKVQAIAAARLGVKSTLEETRTQRFIDIAGRGPMPVPLRYYAAHTGRWGGDDKLNLQNLPRKSGLKASIIPPSGYVILDSDSSQIEARTLAWLAGQNDLVEAFENGDDVYKIMASAIYGKATEEITKDERFVGKQTVLGAGYGMGAKKFQAQLKAFDVVLEESECQRIINVYRETYPRIPELWKRSQAILDSIIGDNADYFGRDNILCVEGKKGIRLPNGLYMKYPNLRKVYMDPADRQDSGIHKAEYVYDTKKGKTTVPNRIYGGKVVENCIAEGTDVLTDRGWVPIAQIQKSDLVHDGVEFVPHGGLLFKSVQACVSIDGVHMTPDHKVLTNEGWQAASQNPQPYRPDIRHVEGVEPRAQQREETVVALPLRVWGAVREGWSRCLQRSETRRHPELRVRNQTATAQGADDTRYEQASGVRSVEIDVGSVPIAYTSSMAELRRQGYNCVYKVARVFREFLGRYGDYISAWAGLGPNRQQRSVFAGELSLGYPSNERHEQAQYRATNRCGGIEQNHGHSTHNTLLPASSWMAGGRTNTPTSTHKQVYDILDAGPRSRFVVRGNSGPFIVHNCCQALARIVIGEQMLLVAKKYRVVMTVHDAIACIAPEDEAARAKEYVELCMRIRPRWAPDLPLNCEAGYGKSYADC